MLGEIVIYNDEGLLKPAIVVKIFSEILVNLLIFEPLENTEEMLNPVKPVTSIYMGQKPGEWLPR